MDKKAEAKTVLRIQAKAFVPKSTSSPTSKPPVSVPAPVTAPPAGFQAPPAGYPVVYPADYPYEYQDGYYPPEYYAQNPNQDGFEEGEEFPPENTKGKEGKNKEKSAKKEPAKKKKPEKKETKKEAKKASPEGKIGKEEDKSKVKEKPKAKSPSKKDSPKSSEKGSFPAPESKKTLEEDKGGLSSESPEVDIPSEPLVAAETDEKREPISMVFIGHVDVGKSTICGNIMIITEKVDARTIKKYEQDAKEKKMDTWWLAYVMDINEDERLRGKTVEVGRATFNTEHKRYTVFDAPGHAYYIPNMIMGAAMADIGALVISAKRGEFESGFDKGGQTIEHMLLAKSLGIQKLIVIVNKMDEQSVRWSKERFEEIKNALTPALNKYGFNVDKYVTWIPLSGLTGANIAKPLDSICRWYTGPTLMELLDKVEIAARDNEGALRIPVLDKLKDQGMDIFGKVHSGHIEVGSKIMIMPYKVPAEISQIQNSDDQLIKYAKAGENIKFRIKGLAREEMLYKGCLLCNPDDLAPVFDVFLAEVKIVNLLPHKQIICIGYQCVLHLHTLAEECTVREINAIKGPKDSEFKKGKFAKEGDTMKCLISTKGRICAEKYDVRPLLGRFTLRDEGKTIAIGKILKYKPIDAAPGTSS